jgi:penicillin amidase
MRMFGFGKRADAAVDELRAMNDPDASAVVTYLESFSAGVNAYIAEIKADPSLIDPAAAAFVAPDKMSPWLPADSLAIGMLQAWSLSYDTTELDMSDAREAGRLAFPAGDANPEKAARAYAALDLFPVEQIDHSSSIPGWPNVEVDSGSRARHAPHPAALFTGPHVSRQLLAQVKNAGRPVGVFGMTFHNREDGSNNWVVGPSLAGAGRTIVANDPHLQLSSPPLFHDIHITVPGKLDVSGVSLAGVPGIVLGHNATLGWGATTSYHDVADFFVEDIHACAQGGGNCVTYAGAEVKLVEDVETFNVGALGTMTDSFTATYEVVPHHGPILPIIAGNRIVPRSAAQGISVQYTGFDDSYEILALYRLQRASTVQAGFDALDVFHFGSQNWVIADDAGHIGWTTNARLPRRTAGCFAFDAATNPFGAAPFYVNPGDGDCQWGEDMDPRYIPHAIDPPAGYVATANADPVGETFDGNALNGPLVDGLPLYAGYDYGPGFREGRITRRLEAYKTAGTPVGLDEMATIQSDTYSNVGAIMAPFILNAIDQLDTGTGPADLASFSPADKAKIDALGAALAAWTYATPAAVESDASAAVLGDSKATVIFNFWQIAFYQLAFGDELAALGSLPRNDFTISTAIWALSDPDHLLTGRSPVTDQALLCDTIGTPAVESCSYQILMGLLDASDHITSLLGSDPTQWKWGRVHQARLDAMVPVDALTLPSADGGYPRPGDSHVIDSANPSISSYDFIYRHGPAMRNLMLFAAGKTPERRFQLPGGEIMDSRSPHYRDQADENWSKNVYVSVPFTPAEVIAKAEERWVLEPR